MLMGNELDAVITGGYYGTSCLNGIAREGFSAEVMGRNQESG